VRSLGQSQCQSEQKWRDARIVTEERGLIIHSSSAFFPLSPGRPRALAVGAVKPMAPCLPSSENEINKEAIKMATAKQRQAARKNIKKAQAAWQSMSSRARSRSQPEGRGRAKPGTTGKGEYYHIEVRPKSEFILFRTQDVGARGGVQRVAGKRGSGSWDTQKWLISKDQAHIEGGRLVPDTRDAREALKSLGTAPSHISGDRFKAAPRENIPEKKKPTPAQKRARLANIRKAQAARRMS
jgi:hypothetical protein